MIPDGQRVAKLKGPHSQKSSTSLNSSMQQVSERQGVVQTFVEPHPQQFGGTAPKDYFQYIGTWRCHHVNNKAWTEDEIEQACEGISNPEDLEMASHRMHNTLCIHFIPFGVPPGQLAQARNWQPVEVWEDGSRLVNYVVKKGEVLNKINSDETMRRAYQQYCEDTNQDGQEDDKDDSGKSTGDKSEEDDVRSEGATGLGGTKVGLEPSSHFVARGCVATSCRALRDNVVDTDNQVRFLPSRQNSEK